MKSLIFKTLDVKRLVDLLKSTKAKDSTILLEFYSDDRFLIKSIDISNNCLKISEKKFSNYFKLDSSNQLPTYLALIINCKEIIESFTIGKYTRSEWELEYEEKDNINNCVNLKLQLSGSQSGSMNRIINCPDNSRFVNVLSKDNNHYRNICKFLISFNLDTKLKKKIIDSTDNILTISYISDELGFKLVFDDGDYLILFNKELKCYSSEEFSFQINCKNLDFLGNEDYLVDISEKYILFTGSKSDEHIIIKTL